MVEANKGFARKILHRMMAFQMAQDHGIPQQALYNAADSGLMEAAIRFDSSRGVAFTTYARYWIRERVYKFIRSELARLSGSKSLAIDLNIRQRAVTFIEDLDGRVTQEELDALAKTQKMVADRVAWLLKEGIDLEDEKENIAGLAHTLKASLYMKPFDAPYREGSNLRINEVVEGSHGDAIIDAIEEGEQQMRLERLLTRLSPVEREIVVQHHLLDRPFKAIASLIHANWNGSSGRDHISSQRAHQICKRAIRKLRKWARAEMPEAKTI